MCVFALHTRTCKCVFVCELVSVPQIYTNYMLVLVAKNLTDFTEVIETFLFSDKTKSCNVSCYRNTLMKMLSSVFDVGYSPASAIVMQISIFLLRTSHNGKKAHGP